MNAEGIQETWDRALNLLSRREHSEQELQTKLVNKGEQANTVSQVIADLKQRIFYLTDALLKCL